MDGRTDGWTDTNYKSRLLDSLSKLTTAAPFLSSHTNLAAKVQATKETEEKEQYDWKSGEGHPSAMSKMFW